jgi:hypothetical protein
MQLSIDTTNIQVSVIYELKPSPDITQVVLKGVRGVYLNSVQNCIQTALVWQDEVELCLETWAAF